MSSLLPSSSLPPNARPDLAFEQYVPVPTKTGSFIQIYAVSNLFYEQVLTVGFNLTTSAAAGTRVVSLEIRNTPRTDVAGAVIWTAPAAQNQAPGTAATYLFSNEIGGTVTPTTILTVSPMPSFTLPPTYSLWIDTLNGDAGDAYTAISIYTRRIPSGPALPDTTPAPVITPVLA